jgi:type IV pilus assembly protein PilQ
MRARKVDPTKLTQGVGYNGEKLSLNFQNIEIRSLLQVIADFTNFNIVTSDSVTGALTLRLKDVPWDQALDIIMQAKNLGMRKNGSVLWIAPKDEINAKEKLEFEAKAAIENLEPLRTQSFQLNYTKAIAIAQGPDGYRCVLGWRWWWRHDDAHLEPSRQRDRRSRARTNCSCPTFRRVWRRSPN